MWKFASIHDERGLSAHVLLLLVVFISISILELKTSGNSMTEFVLPLRIYKWSNSDIDILNYILNVSDLEAFQIFWMARLVLW